MINDLIRARIRQAAVTIAATATAIPTTALPGRISIYIKNTGSNTIYLGNSAVATTDGYPLSAGQAVSFDIGPNVTIYGIVASGTETTRIIEGV